MLLAHTDSGITDTEAHRAYPLFQRELLHLNDDLAVFGEFHRIANQIVHYLSEAQGVSHQVHRNVGGDIQHQLDLFLFGSGIEQIGDVFQYVVNAHIRLIQFQTPRLDFGIIEDVVDDGKQRLR